MAESQRIYKHRKTGKTMITREKLDGRQWELVREVKIGQFTNIKTK